MDSIKDIRICQERAEAGVSAEINRPAAILHAREICRVGVAENPTAERDEAWMLLLFQRIGWHERFVKLYITPLLPVRLPR